MSSFGVFFFAESGSSNNESTLDWLPVSSFFFGSQIVVDSGSFYPKVVEVFFQESTVENCGRFCQERQVPGVSYLRYPMAGLASRWLWKVEYGFEDCPLPLMRQVAEAFVLLSPMVEHVFCQV